MDDGVDAAVMEICAVAMFLVCASLSDFAFREEDAMDEDEAAVVEIETMLRCMGVVGGCGLSGWSVERGDGDESGGLEMVMAGEMGDGLWR